MGKMFNQHFDKELAPYIDHTILKPGTTFSEVEQFCREAIHYGFAGVCIPPCFVNRAAEVLKMYKIKTSTVVGFPFGYCTPAIKLAETANIISSGGEEIDMVVNIGNIKEKNWKALQQELKDISSIINRKGRILKVIIESVLLNQEEIKKVCEICAKLNVDFVQTSTGFVEGNIEVATIASLRKLLPKSIKIKASGRIEDRATAQALIQAGADRLGCDTGVQIVQL